MTTLKDIAAELGLSPATVSRALNGFPEVSAKTRALVEAAARRLDYRPNQAAKKLVSGRSGMVGMVLKREPGGAHDASITEIMFGLSEELAEADIDLVFHATASEDPLTPYKRLIAKKTLDAFIVNGPEVDDPRIDFLRAEGVPFVVHGRAGDDADYGYYDIDNRGAAAEAVHLLADLGHRRIGFLNGIETHAYACARAEGFRAAAAERGISVPGFALVHGVTTESAGYSAALSLFSGRQGKRPTAIYCASTPVAAGVYRAAADLGLSIPGDLSVIAHDDALPQIRAMDFDPALTVTCAPLRDACAPLAQALVGLFEGRPLAERQTTIHADLIIRRSTGPVPPEGDSPW